MPESHYEKHLQRLREKFEVDRLELENMPWKKETTLQELVDQKERDDVKNLKLAFGSTSYHGKPLRLWFTLAR